ncbi:MAG: hypothetical protein DWG76_00615 [Chloroflexi bacterium]|nr:hypothetical protein [Chloroflexota bacterium]MQC25940.1 hypothetical protein [Chloroflexota bacterium]
MSKKLYAFALILLLLTACGAGDQISQEDQVATLVAEALMAEAESAASGELEAATEEAPEPDAGAYGSCTNAELFTVVYVKDGNVWIWLEGGENFALTDSGDVTEVKVSDDGCRIAYAKDVVNPSFDTDVDQFSSPTLLELWVVNSDGSNNQPLVETDFLFGLPLDEGMTSPSIYRFAWQPGSHTLAFSTRVQTYGLVVFDDINLVDANTGAMSTLRAPGEGGNFFFSPDGSQVAYSRSTSINAINTDGSNLREEMITFPYVITYSEFLYYPPVHWSLDGSSIMVAVPPEDGLAPTESGLPPETGLWWIPLDGTPPYMPGSVQAEWFAVQTAQFSPDNGRVAYLRPVGETGSGQRELVIALSDGSNESAQIQEEGILVGAWSLDSNQLVFWFQGPDGSPEIRLLNAADGSVTPGNSLTQFQANVAYFHWALPDAYLQVRYRGADEFIELSLINLDGTGVILDAYQGPPLQVDSSAP